MCIINLDMFNNTVAEINLFSRSVELALKSHSEFGIGLMYKHIPVRVAVIPYIRNETCSCINGIGIVMHCVYIMITGCHHNIQNIALIIC